MADRLRGGHMPQLVTDDGVRLVYDDLGPPDGEAVVLAHGLSSSAEQHIADGHFFAERGYRVLIPDTRGHGRSGRPERLTAGGFTVERLTADIVQLLDQAAVGSVHWVGNSLGGILGLALMRGSETRLR